jgi:hypothetical protein
VYVNSHACNQQTGLTFVLEDILTEFLAPRFAAAASNCFVRFLFGPILTSMIRKIERMKISPKALDKIFLSDIQRF